MVVNPSYFVISVEHNSDRRVRNSLETITRLRGNCGLLRCAVNEMFSGKQGFMPFLINWFLFQFWNSRMYYVTGFGVPIRNIIQQRLPEGLELEERLMN